MLTAYDGFWQAVEEGKNIPVAFPIQAPNGLRGMAAQGVPFRNNPVARALALSDDGIDRAIAAVLAIDFTRSKIRMSGQCVRDSQR